MKVLKTLGLALIAANVLVYLVFTLPMGAMQADFTGPEAQAYLRFLEHQADIDDLAFADGRAVHVEGVALYWQNVTDAAAWNPDGVLSRKEAYTDALVVDNELFLMGPSGIDVLSMDAIL